MDSKTLLGCRYLHRLKVSVVLMSIKFWHGLILQTSISWKWRKKISKKFESHTTRVKQQVRSIKNFLSRFFSLPDIQIMGNNYSCSEWKCWSIDLSFVVCILELSTLFMSSTITDASLSIQRSIFASISSSLGDPCLRVFNFLTRHEEIRRRFSEEPLR